MCHYCGCRDVPLIKDYVAEHEEATELAADAVRALDHGDIAAARDLLAALAVSLRAHWQGEEDGLFRVMGRQSEYADYIAPLVREHRELEDLLATVDLADPVDQERVRTAVAELAEHIAREEDGLFPASLSALSGADWDEAIASWRDAHPGVELRPT
jgi:iron-sulfur cluster repair protein YtfE (RIC family)